MITLTQIALSEIRAVIASDSGIGTRLRVSARKVAPYRFDYDIYFIEPDEVAAEDVEQTVEELMLVVDPTSAEHLEGATIDFMAGPPSGFKFDNPQAKRSFEDPVETQVHEFIEATINPAIAAHGGYISLHGIEDGMAYLEMGGGCQGCGMAAMTLRQGVERQLLERFFSELREIVDVTNHDEGTNPFYQRSR